MPDGGGEQRCFKELLLDEQRKQILELILH